ncbi:MAG: hypothetical protein JNL67_07140 [Planctomycetaceae bacterium]|nr:hypothetical protein [Planctomycetaceae bacterium]
MDSLRESTVQRGLAVPDAIIPSSPRLLLATKKERDAIRLPQIMRHLERLNEATEAVAILLVLTPDDGRPPELAKLGDARVAWSSF